MRRLIDVATLLVLGLSVAIFLGRTSPPEARSVSVYESSWAGVKLAGPSLGSARVVVFYRSTCPACDASRAGWGRLAEAELDIAALSAEATPPPSDYFSEGVEVTNGANVLASLGDIPTVEYVPTTILRASDGSAVKAWVGVFDERDVQELLTLAAGADD